MSEETILIIYLSGFLAGLLIGNGKIAAGIICLVAGFLIMTFFLIFEKIKEEV